MPRAEKSVAFGLWVSLGQHLDLVLDLADHLTYVLGGHDLARPESTQCVLSLRSLCLNVGHPPCNGLWVGTFV